MGYYQHPKCPRADGDCTNIPKGLGAACSAFMYKTGAAGLASRKVPELARSPMPPRSRGTSTYPHRLMGRIGVFRCSLGRLSAALKSKCPLSPHYAPPIFWKRVHPPPCTEKMVTAYPHFHLNRTRAVTRVFSQSHIFFGRSAARDPHVCVSLCACRLSSVVTAVSSCRLYRGC